MSPIRIEVHNENRNGTFVLETSAKNWQEEANTFIKSRAAQLREFDAGLKVWAVMFCGQQRRRIEA